LSAEHVEEYFGEVVDDDYGCLGKLEGGMVEGRDEVGYTYENCEDFVDSIILPHRGGHRDVY
jgi:hypothetical protein